MSTKSTARRALRLSRPDREQFFGLVLVFNNRTLSWSLTRKTLLWILGLVFGFWALAMIGSAYGFWATKKLMSFSQLQRETKEQQQQLSTALSQASQLQDEINRLTHQMNELGRLLDPKSQDPALPPPPPGSTPAPEASKEEKRVSQLRLDLEQSANQAKAIRAHMDPIVQRWNHTPSIWPTAGYLSSSYGLRMSPFSKVNDTDEGLLGYHTGLDITNNEGTPIQATADGIVETAGVFQRYGNAVIVRHANDVETLYAHLSRVDVKVGQRVTRGDILGTMGRTGNATGVHLHYEVRLNGRPVNPHPYMHLQRQWLSGLKK